VNTLAHWFYKFSLWRQAIIAVLMLGMLTACIPNNRLSLLRPNGVVVAPDNSIYIMDRGNYRIVHLSETGKYLEAIGQLGKHQYGPADLYKGWDIDLDAQGNLYVCNMIFMDDGSTILHDGIKVFDTETWETKEIGGEDYSGDLGILGNLPYGLDIDTQGRIYVADLGANTLRIFTSEGKLLGKFFGTKGNGPEEFVDLIDIAVDDSRHLLYALDSSNGRIQQFQLDFNAQGLPTLKLQKIISQYGQEPGTLAYPQSLALDPTTGNLYVADMANFRIDIFGPDGEYLNQLVPEGEDTWQVIGLDISPKNKLYAADALNNTIWIFDLQNGQSQKVEIQP